MSFVTRSTGARRDAEVRGVRGRAEPEGTLRVGKIDIDTSPGVAAQLGVRGVPSIIVFKKGKEAARRLGLANRETILSLVRG